jgi:inhibitor of KinA sporulation pathway (predicted exonuclease)
MEYYLCVLDFEATCWNDNSKPKSQMEIIEFPSVLYKIDEVNSTQTFISEFAKYVRPTINKTLSPFCTELTGITQTVVNSADTFKYVYDQHIKWLETNVPTNSTLIIATCGHWDLRTQLPRELKNKNCKAHSYYSKYINVKDEFENFYKMKAGGMVGMLDKLGLKLDGRHHSGIDDTKNIAKITIHLINSGLTFDKYTINQLNISN